MDVQLVRDDWKHGWQQLRYIKDPNELAEATVTKLMHEVGEFVAAFMQSMVLRAYHSEYPSTVQEADRLDSLAELRAEVADVVGVLAFALKQFGDENPYASIANAATMKAHDFGDFEGLAFITGRLSELANTPDAPSPAVPMATTPLPLKPGRDVGYYYGKVDKPDE